MSFAICSNLDQTKILLSGNGLMSAPGHKFWLSLVSSWKKFIKAQDKNLEQGK